MADETTVDLSAVAAEVSQLTPDQVKAELTKIRVRQKVQQKRQAAKGGQKAYMQKAQARRNALKEAAIKMGLYDEITAEADRQAEAKYAEETAGEESEHETEEQYA